MIISEIRVEMGHDLAREAQSRKGDFVVGRNNSILVC